VSILHPFVRKVGRRLRSLGVGTEGIVVAVSGGPDSVALLRAIAELGRNPGCIVAHLNHRLRGKESDADEEFVGRLHLTLTDDDAITTPFQCERVDTSELAKNAKGNLEAVARKARYDWLTRIALPSNTRWIGTGHTADDQAETVLHRMIRGSGLQGLRGIADRRELHPGISLVRPLLTVRRSAVLAYLDDIGQPYRTDSSNRDTRFTRNRIRLELLPQLTTHFNPKIVEVLCRIARQAQEAHQQELCRAGNLLTAAERPRAGDELVLDRGVLATARRADIRACLRLLWDREGWPTGRLDFAAWDRLAGLVLGENGGADLPGGIRATARERVVRIGVHA
jgi:tRNA(Ile)-lysidine synthase